MIRKWLENACPLIHLFKKKCIQDHQIMPVKTNSKYSSRSMYSQIVITSNNLEFAIWTQCFLIVKDHMVTSTWPYSESFSCYINSISNNIQLCKKNKNAYCAILEARIPPTIHPQRPHLCSMSPLTSELSSKLLHVWIASLVLSTRSSESDQYLYAPLRKYNSIRLIHEMYYKCF